MKGGRKEGREKVEGDEIVDTKKRVAKQRMSEGGIKKKGKNEECDTRKVTQKKRIKEESKEKKKYAPIP